MKPGALAVAAMLAWGAAPVFAAVTYFVAPTGVDNETCGTSSAARCKTVQYAIDKTEDGDSVVVANGTYNECLTVIPGSGVGEVLVVSEAILNSQAVGAAILDGDGVCDSESDAPGPVVTVYDLSALSGFAVKNGGDSGIWGLGAVSIVNNIISENTTPSAGGGIFLTTGGYLTDPEEKAQIKFNVIKENTADEHGGGVYVDAVGDGIPSLVEIAENSILDNTAGGATGGFGGGLAVFTDTFSANDSSTVTITTNVLDGNTAVNATDGSTVSYGGGIFVATGGGFGAGVETIVVGGTEPRNSIRNNTAEGLGGGISANLQPGEGGTHTITVSDNNVTANTGNLGGGGIHAFSVAFDLTAGEHALIIERNPIIGNHAVGDPADPSTVGGGGLYAEVYNYRVPAGITEMIVRRNAIRTNDATTQGGGASLLVYADDDPEADGNTLPTAAGLDFENNLLVGNQAIDEAGAAGAGGAVALNAFAIGAQASVAVRQRFLTVASNLTDPGGVGGLWWNAESLPDSVSGGGSIAIELSNSILIENDDYAVGGPIVPGGAVTTSIAYNDAFENAVGDYEPQLGASTGSNGNVDVDPALDPLFQPPLCSATVDLGDPALAPTEEPLPNGGRVNLGFLGNTINATRTFPDVNADGTIDGLDVLGIAVSFNSATGNPRFFTAADRDLNGLVDGLDLAYVSAFYAQSCP